MFHLMRKDSSYLNQVAVLMPLLFVVWFYKVRPLSIYQSVMTGMWLMIAVLGGMITGEMLEARMKGYAFLRLMPIKDRDIVISKFLMAGLTAVAFVVYVNILFGFLPGPAHLFALGRIMIVFYAEASLILAAFLYILVYRIGFSRSIKIAWTMFFAAILFPILVIEILLPGIDLNYSQIIHTIVSFPWQVWLAVGFACLAAYAGLMILAVKAKEAGRG